MSKKTDEEVEPVEDVPTKVSSPLERQQVAADKVQELGYRGVEGDPTPDEHYTVGGVIAGKPTPETDEDHAEWVRQELRKREKGVK